MKSTAKKSIECEVIELHPIKLISHIERILSAYTRGYTDRQGVADQVSGLMHCFNRTKIYIPNLQLEIQMCYDTGYPMYDSSVISTNKCCPWCGLKYTRNAVNFNNHEGDRIDKVIYACRCGGFYAIYHRKRGEKN